MKKHFIILAVLLPVITLIFAVAIAAGQDQDQSSLSLADRDVFTLENYAINSSSALSPTIYLPIIMKPPGLCFSDDFSDPASGWFVGDSGNAKWTYIDGWYEIRVRRADYWAGSLAVVSPLINYTVKADTYRYIGYESDYGIIFDHKDWNNFYIYAIDPTTQLYGVVKVVDGTPEDIVPLTVSQFINPFNEINHLMVQRAGDQIDIYVNGTHLATASSVGFDGNNEVGLFVESDNSTVAAARTDKFEVWCPDPGTTASYNNRPAQERSSAAAGTIFFDD